MPWFKGAIEKEKGKKKRNINANKKWIFLALRVFKKENKDHNMPTTTKTII